MIEHVFLPIGALSASFLYKLCETKKKACLVPRPPFFVAVEPFRVTWSQRRSSRIRQRNGLTVKAWEKAVQELGKKKATYHLAHLTFPVLCRSTFFLRFFFCFNVKTNMAASFFLRLLIFQLHDSFTCLLSANKGQSRAISIHHSTVLWRSKPVSLSALYNHRVQAKRRPTI